MTVQQLINFLKLLNTDATVYLRSHNYLGEVHHADILLIPQGIALDGDPESGEYDYCGVPWHECFESGELTLDEAVAVLMNSED